MSSRKSLAIITEGARNFVDSRYMIPHLIPFWRAADIEVKVGTLNKPPVADIALLHIDFTQVPRAYEALRARYRFLLNGQFLDNSKTVVSQHLLRPDADYAGPVIVKSDANDGGIRELGSWRLAHGERPGTAGPFTSWATERARSPWLYPLRAALQPCRKYLRTQARNKALARGDHDPFDWKPTSATAKAPYAVFDSISEVPGSVWKNSALVVEKLMTERDAEGNYCMRAHFFLGSQNRQMLVKSHDPVIKNSNSISRELLSSPPPPGLCERQRELGIDFGRMDYVLVNGRAVVFDANKTATISETAVTSMADTLLKHLAEGVLAYFDGSKE